MGLVLKPRKSKSLSIKAGCSVAEELRLGYYTMASIRDDPYMKFLLRLRMEASHVGPSSWYLEICCE
jgi:hypothetical protein